MREGHRVDTIAMALERIDIMARERLEAGAAAGISDLDRPIAWILILPGCRHARKPPTRLDRCDRRAFVCKHPSLLP